MLITMAVMFADSVSACPMCQIALEDAEIDTRPAAFMTSILFMLTIPTLIFGSLGFLLYRINQEEQKVAHQLTIEALAQVHAQ
jgi:hypothetical protein